MQIIQAMFVGADMCIYLIATIGRIGLKLNADYTSDVCWGEYVHLFNRDYRANWVEKGEDQPRLVVLWTLLVRLSGLLFE